MVASVIGNVVIFDLKFVACTVLVRTKNFSHPERCRLSFTQTFSIIKLQNSGILYHWASRVACSFMNLKRTSKIIFCHSCNLHDFLCYVLYMCYYCCCVCFFTLFSLYCYVVCVFCCIYCLYFSMEERRQPSTVIIN